MGNCLNKSRRQVQSSWKEGAQPRTEGVKQKSSSLFHRKRRSTRVAPKSDVSSATHRGSIQVPPTSNNDALDTQEAIDIVSKSSVLSAFYDHSDCDEIKPIEDKSQTNLFAARRDSPYHSSNESIYEEFTEVDENIEEVIEETEDDIEIVLPNVVPVNERESAAETATNPGAGKVTLDMEAVENAIKRLYGLKKELKKSDKKMERADGNDDDVDDILPDNSEIVDKSRSGNIDSRDSRTNLNEAYNNTDEVIKESTVGNPIEDEATERRAIEDNGPKVTEKYDVKSNVIKDKTDVKHTTCNGFVTTELNDEHKDEHNAPPQTALKREDGYKVDTKPDNNIKNNVGKIDKTSHHANKGSDIPIVRTKLIRVKVVDVKHEDDCEPDRNDKIEQNENNVVIENSKEINKSHAFVKVTKRSDMYENHPSTSKGINQQASETCDSQMRRRVDDIDKSLVYGKPLKGFTKSESDVDKLKSGNREDERNCKSETKMPAHKDYKQDAVRSLAKKLSQESLDRITNHKSRSDYEFSMFVKSPTSENMPRMIQVKASNKQVQDGTAKAFIKQKENVIAPEQHFNELPESKKYKRRNTRDVSKLIDDGCHVKWTERSGQSSDNVLTSVPAFYKPPSKTKTALETLGLEKLQKFGIIPQCKEIERLKLNDDQFPGILPPKIRQKWVQKKNEKKYVN